MSYGGMRREVEQLVKEAERQGWTVTRTAGNRYIFTNPNGQGPVFLSSSPTDYRSVPNVIPRLRRLGLIWKGR